MAKKIKIKVRNGYVFFHGPRVYKEGEEAEIMEEAIKGQEWKVEVVKKSQEDKEVKNKEDKMVKEAKTK